MAKSKLVEKPVEEEVKPVQKAPAPVVEEVKEEVVADPGNTTRGFRQ
jgi:hypothetical protein